ncbi:FAD-dependent monooxygenase [Novosphingobium terrae]|uniref:FAD-dependent monooxygenase n=1 Tax=Novosphingobium terrae TaxID=2726189 RepID=UPI00198264EB|nr:FAD-dependent monooxygenase [Novosphingobium terrae]
MACISTALIVGGSIAGMNAAIALAQQGVTVDVVELSHEALGASLAFSGRAAMALVELGIYDEVYATGRPDLPGNTAVSIRSAATGEILNPGPARPTWPGAVPGVGVFRPTFLAVAQAHAERLGVRIRKGVTYETIEEDADGVTVTFTDGETGRYDLLVGAEGIRSKLREKVFPDAPAPKFAGQLSIRWMVPGEPVPDEGWYASPAGRLGFYYLPGAGTYVPSVINIPEPRWYSQDEVRAIFTGLLDTMQAPAIRELRARLTDSSELIGRQFEWILLEDRWYKGRILLIGDAAHATSAHMGMGGGMALEDAVVLGQEIGGAATLPEALAQFMERRYERVKLVVETSVRLGQLEQERAPHSENVALLTKAFSKLGTPY